MAQLFVDAEKIARARELARSAAMGVQAFIGRHTTVSIERTVLRLLGISGTGARGAPLANLMVDRLRDARVLQRGAAYWLGRVLRASPGKDPLQAIERIAAHPEKLPPLPAAEDQQLGEESKRLGRYVHLTNYSSGLCMPEIAFMAAYERLDMLLNDAMYGILFRDINMQRTFCDQYFSRRICAFAEIIINTGEDNYITTADADEAAHTVIASQLVNETFAHLAGMPDELIGFGHSFEIDPAREDTLLREFAMAMMVRELFPRSPIKYMPPTKHKEGDIFFSHAYDVMSDLVAIATGQRLQLLGMMTEAMHNPFLMDRYVALKSAAYVYRAARHLGDEIAFKPDGIVARRQREVFDEALALLEEVAKDGMMAAIGKARFGDTARTPEGGKGLEGVVEKGPEYFNPFLEILEGAP